MRVEEVRNEGVGVGRLSIFIIAGIIHIISTAIKAVELLYKLVYYRIIYSHQV